MYSKASIYRMDANGAMMSIDGNVTLRADAHDGGTGGRDAIGITVISSKDSSLYYSNNWVYDSVTYRNLPLLRRLGRKRILQSSRREYICIRLRSDLGVWKDYASQLNGRSKAGSCRITFAPKRIPGSRRFGVRHSADRLVVASS